MNCPDCLIDTLKWNNSMEERPEGVYLSEGWLCTTCGSHFDAIDLLKAQHKDAGKEPIQ